MEKWNVVSSSFHVAGGTDEWCIKIMLLRQKIKFLVRTSKMKQKLRISNRVRQALYNLLVVGG